MISNRCIVRPLWAAVIVAALQTGVIGYMVQSRAAILRNGAEVVLKAAPVDPRDLLRGDYVVLSYDISTVPVASLVGQQPGYKNDARLWVRLKPEADGYWAVAESSFSELPEMAGSVVMRSQPFKAIMLSPDGAFHVTYGIERYFVPEGEGHLLEEARQAGAVSIVARVSNSGEAQIRDLRVDGKPVYQEPLY
ncbi:GDYXXLXY domain-containing protein [Oryzifoliimicrobium ureilyticus]|uniref:GDYXXLXY domain-containing protein n=1 Tax=Oryzifoliimicrobium ureilyticus TaxID=3113724 RepID=UPI0030766AE3